MIKNTMQHQFPTMPTAHPSKRALVVLVFGCMIAFVLPSYGAYFPGFGYVLISPSAEANGRAGVYGLETADPFAALWNPAMAGLLGQRNGICGTATTNTSEYPLPNDLRQSYWSRACMIGFRTPDKKYYSRSKFAFGLVYADAFLNTDYYGSYSLKESCQNITAGFYIPWRGFRIAAGATAKYANSKMIELQQNVEEERECDAHAFDLGSLFELPIHEWFPRSYFYDYRSGFGLFTTVTGGFSLLNIGEDSEYYYYQSEKIPLPRLVRLNTSLSFGLNVFHPLGMDWTIASLEAISSSEDLLLRYRNGDFVFTQIPGDIDPIKNTVLREGNRSISSKYGIQLNFLDFVTFRSGRILSDIEQSDLDSKIYSRGYSIRLKGLLYAVSSQSITMNIGILNYFVKHFDLAYSHSQWKAISFIGTETVYYNQISAMFNFHR